MTCDRVVIINKGKILAEDTPANLIARSAGLQQIRLQVRGPQSEVATLLQAQPEIENCIYGGQDDADLHSFHMQSRKMGVQAQLARSIVAQDWDLMALQTASGSLEDVFIQLVTKEGGAD